MIGRVLNDRYELIEKIGTGGMAIVYLAKDKLLARQVAIKILQPQFADNETAVKRFNHEAQAVASLSHPNIVNIFDIGREDDTYYIVMEYITGNDLKEELKSIKRLEIGKAVRIAKEVCHALVKAHRNNIIHCDIKPHNILLTTDGRVKVTDFGIAQAVTAATMTQTNSIMGSAHYLSPEQAKGSKVTARSDIYSLGIVLYELVTGKVPFTGDSHVSVALKHIEEEPIIPKGLNPDIPSELVNVILKAIAKRPENRYNSAVEMLKDLKEIHKGIDNRLEVSDQHTMIMSKEDYNNEVSTTVSKQLKEKSRGVGIVGEKELDTTSDGKLEVNKKSRKSRTLTILGVIGFICLAIMAGGYYMLVNYLDVEEVRVPNLAGEHIEVARQDLAVEGLQLKINYKSYSQDVEKDHIISQNPTPNKRVKKNRIINVVVSRGAKLSTVPKLSGKTLREARIELDKVDLEIGEIKKEYNEEINEGKIISQEPRAKTEVKAGSKLNLVISKGREPQEVVVPNLVGLRREEAVQKLRDNNLILGQVLERESLNYRKGRVIAQKPQEGERLVEDSTVQLIISKGIRNPNNAKIRSQVVRIPDVPPGKDKRVQIIIKDDNGERTVYDRVHQPHDRIEKEVITVGPAIIRVYFDGKLNYEKRL